MNKKTFIVLGNYRGDTSVVAGLLQQLGLFIGDSLDEGEAYPSKIYPNYEDLAFQKKSLEQVEEKIQERNDEYDQWGFKDPKTIERIEEIYPFLRNPYLICVFRDPWAVTQSELRHDSSDTIKSLFETANQFHNKMARLVWNAEEIVGDEPPILSISYEAVIRHPEREIKRLAKFMEISLDEELLQDCKNLIHT